MDGSKKEGAVLSKREGGEWAAEHLPAEYHPLIMDAMREYADNAEIRYDGVLAKRYAEYMMRHSRRSRRKSGLHFVHRTDILQASYERS